MSFLKNTEIKLLVLIHGWGSIFLGLVLIVITATGTVAVFSEEIGQWTAGADEIPAHLVPPLDAAVRRLLADIPPQPIFLNLSLSRSGAGGIQATVVGRADGKRQQTMYELGPETMYELGPDGAFRMLANHPGFLPGPDEDHHTRAFLEHFFVNMHARLGIKGPAGWWGVLILGLGGLTMLSAIISGLVIHWKHLVSDVFTFRKNAQPKVSRKDAHTVVGSWILPFAFIWAFTGAYFGLGLVTQYMMMEGGGHLPASMSMRPSAPASAPVAMANLDDVLADAIKRDGGEPRSLTISHLESAEARINIYNGPYGRGGALNDTYLLYNGVDGHFISQNPTIPPTVVDLTRATLRPLHFGYFAGLFSKIIWGCLGVAMTNLTLSGIRLWVATREAKEPGWIVLDRVTTIVVYGLILADATCAAGFFLSLPNGNPDIWTNWGFIAGALAAIAIGIVTPRRSASSVLRCCAALVVLALPILRLHGGGPGWGSALATDRSLVVVGDIAMLAIALLLLAKPLRTFLLETGMLPRGTDLSRHPQPDTAAAE